MKKNLFTAMLGLSIVLFAASCSKSDTTPAPGNNAQGKWVGNYSNGIGGPLFYFSLNFKAGGALVVEANSALSPDVANGTWTQVSDSVNATYTYVGSSSVNSLVGHFSSDSKTLTGTIGVGSSTTGSGVFSVTKE